MMIELGGLDDLVSNGFSLETDKAMAHAIAKPPIQFFLIELNRRRQLFFQGKDAQGKLLSQIGGPYSPFTLAEKEGTRPNNSPNLINLFDTGEFYDSFTIIVQNDGFVIEADTIKEGVDLQDRWGDELIGLADESIEFSKPTMTPPVQEYVVETLLK